jgi:hypothetical protein
MEISFISSLTAEDETRFAAAFMTAMSELLDALPIAYVIRIKTASGSTVHRTHTPEEADEAAAPSLASRLMTTVRPFAPQSEYGGQKLHDGRLGL